ncbi:hypothetical protein WBP06_03915 [Novosphingobium sp. BL-8H]|uniref:hypothetical protein n=1 Tax=Novosphingobium sp. BL-8H TaxID=3127640 RepID=UPI0037576676
MGTGGDSEIGTAATLAFCRDETAVPINHCPTEAPGAQHIGNLLRGEDCVIVDRRRRSMASLYAVIDLAKVYDQIIHLKVERVSQ